MLERVFGLRAHDTTVRRELLGGATITLMVFSYDIGNGLTAGLVVYPSVKAAAGRFNEVKPGALVLAAVCAAYYVFGLPH